MTILRITVRCFRCNREITKAEALPIKGPTNASKFSCHSCYKIYKDPRWGLEEESSVKKAYFCERCKYKFTSRRTVCPYCNKADLVSEADITVRDLL